MFKLHDHTSYQKKKIHNHTELLYFFFFFLIQQNCYILLCTNIQKKTHTQILKKHISKINLFLQTNKLLIDVFISSKSVYYKAQ